MPRRQFRRASSAVEVEGAFMAASTARRRAAGKARPTWAKSVRFGRSLPRAIRTMATSMPSAEVPLMMPATVMVFAFMLEVPGAGAGRPLWFGQSAQFDCEEVQAADRKALDRKSVV